jgi:predicted nuclease of predicted toxin-antitoxin system
VRLLIDQNRSPRLASLLRDRGRDAVRTLELGSERAEDDALLMRAAEEDRVIVSGDTDVLIGTDTERRCRAGDG